MEQRLPLAPVTIKDGHEVPARMRILRSPHVNSHRKLLTICLFRREAWLAVRARSDLSSLYKRSNDIMNDLASWVLSVFVMGRSLSCREFDNYKFVMVAAELWDFSIKSVTEEQSYCKLCEFLMKIYFLFTMRYVKSKQIASTLFFIKSICAISFTSEWSH